VKVVPSGVTSDKTAVSKNVHPAKVYRPRFAKQNKSKTGTIIIGLVEGVAYHAILDPVEATLFAITLDLDLQKKDSIQGRRISGWWICRRRETVPFRTSFSARPPAPPP